MNWDDLADKRIPAPFVPKIKGELDVSNFSDEFTTMVPADSPAIVPVNSEKLFKVSTILTGGSPVSLAGRCRVKRNCEVFQIDSFKRNAALCYL